LALLNRNERWAHLVHLLLVTAVLAPKDGEFGPVLKAWILHFKPPGLNFSLAVIKLALELDDGCLRIPINSDTCSNPIRTVFRDIRTVVGAKRRSVLTFKGVSELSQAFPVVDGLFFGAWKATSSRV
jgi:hypothetical protein